MGRNAEFKTFLIKGGRTIPLYIIGADKGMEYRVVAALGTNDQNGSTVSANVVPAPVTDGKLKHVQIIGVKYHGLDTNASTDDRTELSIQVPEFDWLWPTVTFYVAGCSVGGGGTGASQEGFVAVVQSRVSHARLSQLLSLTVVGLIYVLAALGVRSISVPPIGFLRALNPFRITAGISGQSSVSNLQIFVFTLIVLGLMVYVLVRTGELSDISASVAWLLGIVGVGTGASRLVTTHKQQIEPGNLTWLLQRGWVKLEPTVANLVTQDGEFSVTRFQSIAFSLLVAIALLISGPGELATFTVPESILGLLVASQAIYVGGKWIQPAADTERPKEINEKIRVLRSLEVELIKKIPPGTPEAQRGNAIASLNEYPAYKDQAAEAANLVAMYFEVKMPEKGLYGVPLT